MSSTKSGFMGAGEGSPVVARGAWRASTGVRAAVRVALLAGAASVLASQLAIADPDPAAKDDELEDVVVTGTRVVRDGYQAPTPVSVVTAEELQNFASPNVADALNTLPSIVGSTSPQTSQTSASGSNSGINAVSLRNIGASRTLVLVNGQRIVASSTNGLVDINTIPQELIKRVEVVTGGASASWGSDAVGGVVNFILDDKYTGLKSSLDVGATNYGDNQSARFTITGGTGFADNRGHVTFSGSFDRADPVILNRRDWNLRGWQMVGNPLYGTGTGQSTSVPQRLVLDQIGSYMGVIGGVIGRGPLKGTAFGPGGVPYTVGADSEVYCMSTCTFQVIRGGSMWSQTDIRGKHGGAPLASRMRDMGGLMNATFDLSDSITASLMLSRNRSQTANWAYSNEDYNSVEIKSGNPFIPASVQAAMTANGLSSIFIGSMHPDLDIAVATGDRTVSRGSFSLDGKFGDGWTWNAYYQYGLGKQHYSTPGMWDVPNLAKAYDAVINPTTGAIVCRVTLTNPSDPCQPYNPMGIGVNTQAAVDYVEGNGIIQERMNYMSQNVASATVNGTPFSLWAGDVSIAGGAEWRREWMGDSWVDALSYAKSWWGGNALPSHGEYNVKEAFLETVVPLAKDLPFAQSADLQAAVREEDYSTAGKVTAWKVGTTWKPFNSVTLRGSVSHDIRAPNLIELYSNGTGGAPYVDDPWLGSSYGTTTQTVGNPALKPEISDSWGAGIVFQPEFVPGFGASVDYWDTKIKDAIGSAGSLSTIVNNCYQGQTEYCSLITFGTGGPGVGRILGVILGQVNNANAKYRGVDIESSYRVSPGFMPGNISLRVLATHFLESSNVSTSGVYTDVVGNNSGNVPHWRWTASANWANAGWRAGLTARGVSAGVYNKYYVECSTACPVSAPSTNTRAYTINNNHIAGAIYLDGSLSHDFTFGDNSKLQLFLNVRNLMNKDPAVVAAYSSYGDTLSPANASLYDVMGRVFNAGVRIEF